MLLGSRCCRPATSQVKFLLVLSFWLILASIKLGPKKLLLWLTEFATGFWHQARRTLHLGEEPDLQSTLAYELGTLSVSTLFCLFIIASLIWSFLW